jgi:hypothetical protein
LPWKYAEIALNASGLLEEIARQGRVIIELERDMKGTMAEVERLRAQNSELLEACKLANRFLNGLPHTKAMDDAVAELGGFTLSEKIRIVIAKARAA